MSSCWGSMSMAEVVNMATSSATSDENDVNWITSLFQWRYLPIVYYSDCVGRYKYINPTPGIPNPQEHDSISRRFSLPSTGDPCIIHKNWPVECECKLNNVNLHIIRNQYQILNRIEVTSNEDRYCKLCHYQTSTEFKYSIQISSESPMEYFLRSSIPKETKWK